MMILVTGGSGSGKSAYAEDRVLSFGDGRRIYIATMYPFDLESKKRIDRHRRMRAGKGFETVECYTGLKDLVLPGDSTVLLECMSNLVANEMFSENGRKEQTAQKIYEGILHVREQAEHLVIVTNQVFSDGITYDTGTEEYLKVMAEVNRLAAESADAVCEVVHGIPVFLRGKGI